MYFRFDTETQVWTSLASMPHGAYSYGAVEFKGKIYVAGAVKSGYYTDCFQCYNPDTDSWSMKANIPYAGAPFLIKSSDIIYAIRSNGDIHQYDVNQNRWSKVIQFE